MKVVPRLGRNTELEGTNMSAVATACKNNMLQRNNLLSVLCHFVPHSDHVNVVFRSQIRKINVSVLHIVNTSNTKQLYFLIFLYVVL